MLERLLRGVQLPGRDEIAAERARRVSTIDGLPTGWEHFSSFSHWMRLEEMELIRAELERVDQAGGGITGPLLERIHRRATIRFLLGLRPQWLGVLPLGVGDCIGALETREGLGYVRRWRPRTECGCLVAAVERAEVVEVNLGRAALLAARLAKRAHRERWRARRKECQVRAPVAPPRTGIARALEPIREQIAEHDVDAPEFVPRSRSLSPVRHRQLTDREVADMNARLGFTGAPRSRVMRDGRVLWDE